MSQEQKVRLEILMRKYLDRTCSTSERNELVELIKETSSIEEVDEMWREVWTNIDGSDQLEKLSWEKLQELSIPEASKKLKVVWRKVYKWSAIAAVLIGVYFAGHRWISGNELMIYETGYGESLEIVLDDGTKVNLNADSKLSWDINWKKNGLRKVELEGEAYFDVSQIESSEKDAESIVSQRAETSTRLPFEVLTTDVTIRVLGTAFNASQRRGKTEVFLERGSVALSLNRQNGINPKKSSNEKTKPVLQPQEPNTSENKSTAEELIQMKPGEWISYSSEEEMLVQKTLSEAAEKMEWKDGTLSYQDVEFRVMLQNLEDIYGMKFELEDQDLLEKRVNFSVPYKDWETVKEMMEWMLKIEVKELNEKWVHIEKRKGD